MLIDLSLPINAQDLALGKAHKSLIDAGHVGTHFDVVNKSFSLENFRLPGKVFDISKIRDREIEVPDLVGAQVEPGDFVVLYTGLLDEFGYNTDPYSSRSAELSDAVIDYLLERGTRLIGVDAAGVQKPRKHSAVDQYCADRGVFIVENLNNVRLLVALCASPLTIYTAPLSRTDWTGLPCRVLAELA
jgi:kynurenine formamidase